MSWTQQRENKLRELWEKGYTASQIAEMIGETTRNAVIGKAHRLNLQARASSKKVKVKTILQKTFQNFKNDLRILEPVCQ